MMMMMMEVRIIYDDDDDDCHDIEVCVTRSCCVINTSTYSSDVTMGMMIIHQSTPYRLIIIIIIYPISFSIIIPWYNRALLYEEVLLYHSAHSVYE